MANEDEFEEEEKGRPDIDQVDLVKSYLAFVGRSVKKRLRLSLLVFVAVLAISVGAWKLWPRTYDCESTVVFYPGGALASTAQEAPFRSAAEVVLRRESLLEAIKATELVRRYPQDRPPLLRAKDKVTQFFSGPISERDIESVLVWSLGTAVWVNATENTATIGIKWGNAEMAAKLVSSLQKILLNARHVAEISTIQEKMVILEGHSREVRKEIDSIAQELNDARKEKLAGIERSVTPSPASSVAAATPAPRPVRSPPRPAASAALSPEEVSQQKEALAQLKEDLEVKKRAVTELKNQRSQGLITAQAQLTELLTRYTREHPEVVRAERTIANLSQRSPQIIALEAEIKGLETKVKESGATASAASRGTSGGRSGSAAAPAALAAQEALPADILRLLEPETQTDTAVNVQLEGAVNKYATLREGIRSARVDLDTAQAAFAHRYKVVQPAEEPRAPSKPERAKVLGVGFLAALLLGLLLPIAAELRTGVIVERWQVYQMQLPVLAELPLPPGSSE